MRKRDVHLSDDQFEDLWERFNKVKAGTKNVSVPVDALFNLLRDHSALYRDAFPGEFSIQAKGKGE